MILGKPLLMYLGILTLVSLLFTALIAGLNKKGVKVIPFQWHPRMAAVAIFLALLHGLLAVLTYF
ncbi:MAG: hypothetical protein FJY77_03455 [Candidatus Altiarchaeales archaeon]|nr:hypothetical protein [Candidatus Altiarchaeales archaeon]